MKAHSRLELLWILSVLLLFSACRKSETPAVAESSVRAVNVVATRIKQQPMTAIQSYQGRTIYLNKAEITAPISGYLVHSYAKFGMSVTKGDLLFEMQTAEQKALQTSTANTIKIYAPVDGYFNQIVTINKGAFTTEGSLLCSIIDNNQAFIQASLPFEITQTLNAQETYTIILPDQSMFEGKVFKILPTVDAQTQLQQVLLRPIEKMKALPENLNLQIEIKIAAHPNALTVPAPAILSNEELTEFWVFKISEKSKAVKIPVTLGIQMNHTCEVFSEKLKPNDLIVLKGGYGLPNHSDVAFAQP